MVGELRGRECVVRVCVAWLFESRVVKDGVFSVRVAWAFVSRVVKDGVGCVGERVWFVCVLRGYSSRHG